MSDDMVPLREFNELAHGCIMLMAKLRSDLAAAQARIKVLERENVAMTEAERLLQISLVEEHCQRVAASTLAHAAQMRVTVAESDLAAALAREKALRRALRCVQASGYTDEIELLLPNGDCAAFPYRGESDLGQEVVNGWLALRDAALAQPQEGA